MDQGQKCLVGRGTQHKSCNFLLVRAANLRLSFPQLFSMIPVAFCPPAPTKILVTSVSPAPTEFMLEKLLLSGMGISEFFCVCSDRYGLYHLDVIALFLSI